VTSGSAADVGAILQRLNLPLAQYVVSGIPLGTMPEALRTDIVAKTRTALAPGGQFLVYQFTSRVLPALQHTFQEVSRSRTKRNIPPAHLFVCATDAG
jgi:phospholipid N-methyltransferase